MADLDIDELNELYRCVGLTVVQWALIEQALNMCVAAIYQLLRGDTVAYEMPRQLKRKIKYTRKAFRTLPALEPLKDIGLDLMQRISDQQQTRHNVVHGAVASLTHENKEYIFRHIKLEQHTHTTKDAKFDLKEIPSLAKELQDLGIDMAVLAKLLVEKRDQLR